MPSTRKPSTFRKPSTKTTRDILRLPQIENGLTLVHANICDSDLDFSHPPTVASNIQDALAGLVEQTTGLSRENESDENQLRVWREECESIDKFVEREVTQLNDLEQLIEENARENSHRQGEQLAELRQAEIKTEEIGDELRRVEQRIDEQTSELADLQKKLAQDERAGIDVPRNDPTTLRLTARLDQLDRRILRWRKKQREISQEIFRSREAMVAGSVANYPEVTRTLDDVRRRLLRLEQSAEELVDVVQTSSTMRRETNRNDVSDDFEAFKKDLESAYNGLHDVHSQASRRIAELERERVEWNLRSMRRQVREIERTIQKLLKLRSDTLAKLAAIYPNQGWLTLRAQTGYCYCATSQETTSACDIETCESHGCGENHALDYSAHSRLRDSALSNRTSSLRCQITELKALRDQSKSRRAQLQTELESITARCARLRQVMDQFNASESESQLQERAGDTRVKIREAQSYLLSLRQRIRDYEGRRIAKLHRVLDEASAHLAKFSGGSLRDVNADRDSLRLVVHDSRGDKQVVSAMSNQVQALVYLCVAIELLPYWSSLHRHASWNLALDSLSLTDAEECAVLLNSYCPENFKLIVATGRQEMADGLSRCGLRVLRLELPPTIVPQTNPPREDRVPEEHRGIIMRSNNSDAEEFPGEFRDQVMRNPSHSPRSRIYHEALTEAYDSAQMQLDRLEDSLDDFEMLEPPAAYWADRSIAEADVEPSPSVVEPARFRAESSHEDARSNREDGSIQESLNVDCEINRDSRLRDLGIIPEAALHRLESEGVFLVRDLLAWTPERLAHQLQIHEASAESIRNWQRHAELRYQIPKLSRFDASVLIACDVSTAESLRRLEGFELADRIERLRRTNAGQKLIRSGSDDELAKLNAWILNMKESKRLQRFGYADSHEEPVAAEKHETAQVRIHEKLKFHLDLDSDVEAAPSIGARMAEHLAKINVLTVRDLLNESPSEIARKLDHRRVNPSVVSLWQKQAALVCSIPNLRGHDAQLLVACDIDSPQVLAGYQPESLFAIVGPFSMTRDGAKIIRGGKLPDLEEVTDWIRWAQHHRVIKAA